MDAVLATAISAPILAAWVAALSYAMVRVARSAGLSPAGRAAWVIAILLAPVPAALVWGIVGPHPWDFSRHLRSTRLSTRRSHSVQVTVTSR